MIAPTRAPRRPSLNVPLDQSLVVAARELGIDVSRACELGLAREIKAAREARWREENAEAISSSNSYVKEHGLPLANYRRV